MRSSLTSLDKASRLDKLGRLDALPKSVDVDDTAMVCMKNGFLNEYT